MTMGQYLLNMLCFILTLIKYVHCPSLIKLFCYSLQSQIKSSGPFFGLQPSNVMKLHCVLPREEGCSQKGFSIAITALTVFSLECMFPQMKVFSFFPYVNERGILCRETRNCKHIQGMFPHIKNCLSLNSIKIENADIQGLLTV